MMTKLGFPSEKYLNVKIYCKIYDAQLKEL